MQNWATYRSLYLRLENAKSDNTDFDSLSSDWPGQGPDSVETLEREGHGAARMRIGRSVGVLLQTALSWPPCCVYCMMQCEKELSMPIDQN
ncbi:hypothetical protein QE152_g10406 [Popillia japonica]|uniref:Uncharacterized protein n=1 Tax=Popillia japonica TaxID=7064 RepID=A0AAW1LUN9_POPJA